MASRVNPGATSAVARAVHHDLETSPDGLVAGGFLAHDTVLLGLAPALSFVCIHLVIENFVLPAIMGRRFEVNAFVIFTAIVFWSWMWGAAGAMLALPLSIIGMTIVDELRPGRKIQPVLPG